MLTAEPSQDQTPSRFTLRVSLDTEKSDPKPFSIMARIGWSSYLTTVARRVRWRRCSSGI